MNVDRPRTPFDVNELQDLHAFVARVGLDPEDGAEYGFSYFDRAWALTRNGQVIVPTGIDANVQRRRAIRAAAEGRRVEPERRGRR